MTYTARNRTPPTRRYQARNTIADALGTGTVEQLLNQLFPPETAPEPATPPEPLKPAYTAPVARWTGIEPNLDDAARTIIEKQLNASSDSEKGRLRYLIREDDVQIDYLTRELRRLQEMLKQRKLQRAGYAAELAALDAHAHGTLAADPQQITDLCTFLRDKLPGVLGIRTSEAGDITLLLRTAIRDENGALYDMGDYELTLPHGGMNLPYGGWAELAQALDVKCVRLPRSYYDSMRLQMDYIEVRLYHHHGEVRRYDDGTAYLHGGTFCIGDRAIRVAKLLKTGDIPQALSLYVASLNDSQDRYRIPRHGVLIAPENENAFYAGSNH